ncbi:hypothetical protein HOI71_11795, partial [Candidatus Poribacteria bacterium]|nr:hypothetical protein [Candidatus Poribacteria bacterium]
QVQVGMSEAQVRELFGPPYRLYDHAATGAPGEIAWEYVCADTTSDGLVVMFSDGAVAEFGVGVSPQLPAVAKRSWDWDPNEGSDENAADITRVEIQPVGRVEGGWGYTYRLSLHSNSDITLRVKVTIEWWDASDFTVHSETIEDVLLVAGREQRASGAAVIPRDIADRIVAPVVGWEWQRA